MSPQASPATHNRTDGQDTLLNPRFVRSHEKWVACQARDPPVGSAEVRICAEIEADAVRAQKCAVGHEIDSSAAFETIRPARRERAFVGFLEHKTLPLSTPKHSFAVGQLNAENEMRGRSRVSFQLPAPLVARHAATPPSGFADVTTPSSSSTTHRCADGHATFSIAGVVANGCSSPGVGLLSICSYFGSANLRLLHRPAGRNPDGGDRVRGAGRTVSVRVGLVRREHARGDVPGRTGPSRVCRRYLSGVEGQHRSAQ